jgi:hypothetical protein
MTTNLTIPASSTSLRPAANISIAIEIYSNSGCDFSNRCEQNTTACATPQRRALALSKTLNDLKFFTFTLF